MAKFLESIRSQGWRTAARRSYITDMAFAMERVQRMFGDRPKPDGPPPVTPQDPTGIPQVCALSGTTPGPQWYRI
jgi:hypothetical protein